jgi:hypothetical protein
MFLDYVLLEPLLEGGWEEIKVFVQKCTLDGTNDTRWNDFGAFSPGQPRVRVCAQYDHFPART